MIPSISPRSRSSPHAVHSGFAAPAGHRFPARSHSCTDIRSSRIFIALHLQNTYHERDSFRAPSACRHDPITPKDSRHAHARFSTIFSTSPAAAVAPAEAVLATATGQIRDAVSEDGKVSAAKLEEHQSAAHALAWLATYVEALRQMQKWAEALSAEGRFGEMEQLIHQIAFGEYLWQIQGGIPMSQNEIAKLQRHVRRPPTTSAR